MADVQSQFYKFHDAIRLDYQSNKPLMDKRDIVVKDLRNGLSRLFYAGSVPTFSAFNQGSYDLAMGVVPLPPDDYDIDVGIVFNFSKAAYKPVQVKEWVYSALNTGARTVIIKRPCIRVQYHKDGAEWFHVDLAIYALDKDFWGNDIYHIAKGFVGSTEDKKIWEPSEPFKLKELLKKHISNQLDRDQFRRVVRYLKRWKNYKFQPGPGRPTGIALTACCYKTFSPRVFSYTQQYTDLHAMLNVVEGILGLFDWNNRIRVELPVTPYNNLFEKMSDRHMLSFKNELIALQDILIKASNDINPTTACFRLRGAFGGDFPSI